MARRLPNRPVVILGVDPSSQKMAAVVTRPDDPTVDMRTEKMKGGEPDRTRACATVFRWMQSIADDYPGHLVYVCMERATLVSKSGANALIPQALVQGAVLTWCGLNDAIFRSVAIPDWKKAIVGSGNASKTTVAAWVAQSWPLVWKNCPLTKQDGQMRKDQDLLDAACINRYGHEKYIALARRKKLI